MFLENLTKREKKLLYLTIAAIFLSIIYNLLFKPLRKRWDHLNNQLLNKEIELIKNIRYIKEKNRVKEIYQIYASYVKKRGSDEQEMAAFLNQVEKEARVANIQIANIRPRPIRDLTFYKKYSLEMDCRLSVGKCIEFIYNLHKSAQLIRVEKLKLTSSNKDSPLLKARILVSKVITTE